jgi:hypothetical protein
LPIAAKPLESGVRDIMVSKEAVTLSVTGSRGRLLAHREKPGDLPIKPERDNPGKIHPITGIHPGN